MKNNLIGCGVLLLIFLCLGIWRASVDERNSTAPFDQPEVSLLDGVSIAIKDYLREHARDPKSIEYIECSLPAKMSDGRYAQRVKYRGRNGFGGMNVEEKVFVLKDGKVVHSHDFTC